MILFKCKHTITYIPYGCHSNKSPPETFPWSFKKWLWEFIWIAKSILKNKYLRNCKQIIMQCIRGISLKKNVFEISSSGPVSLFLWFPVDFYWFLWIFLISFDFLNIGTWFLRFTRCIQHVLLRRKNDFICDLIC